METSFILSLSFAKWSGSNDNKTHTFTSHFLYISPFCLKAFGNNHTISVGHFREVDAGPLYIIHACAKVVSTAEIGKIIAVCRRICASRVVNPNSLFPWDVWTLTNSTWLALPVFFSLSQRVTAENAKHQESQSRVTFPFFPCKLFITPHNFVHAVVQNPLCSCFSSGLT